MTRKARRTDVSDRDADVQRYEQLRYQALDGGPSGFALGLALLERRGVAAWRRTFKATTTTREPPRSAGSVVALPSSSSELVDVLASMALARVAAG